MCRLAEGRGNHGLIDETSLNAVSALLRACPDIVEDSTDAMLQMFDAVPIGPLMMIANELRGHVHQGHALAGMIYLHLRTVREGTLTARQADHHKTAKASVNEVEKGRKGISRREIARDRQMALGMRLLAAKASLPHGKFGPWLRDQPVGYDTAMSAMRLARAV